MDDKGVGQESTLKVLHLAYIAYILHHLSFFPATFLDSYSSRSISFCQSNQLFAAKL